MVEKIPGYQVVRFCLIRELDSIREWVLNYGFIHLPQYSCVGEDNIVESFWWELPIPEIILGTKRLPKFALRFRCVCAAFAKLACRAADMHEYSDLV